MRLGPLGCGAHRREAFNFCETLEWPSSKDRVIYANFVLRSATLTKGVTKNWFRNGMSLEITIAECMHSTFANNEVL